MQGSVLSKTDRAPLRNANVELRLITEESTDNNRASSRNGGRGQRDMFRQFRGDGPRTTRVLSTRTKRDGTFEITMESGLRIEGVVVDAATSAPVTSYGIRVQRVGGLPDPKAASIGSMSPSPRTRRDP